MKARKKAPPPSDEEWQRLNNDFYEKMITSAPLRSPQQFEVGEDGWPRVVAGPKGRSPHD